MILPTTSHNGKAVSVIRVINLTASALPTANRSESPFATWLGLDSQRRPQSPHPPLPHGLSFFNGIRLLPLHPALMPRETSAESPDGIPCHTNKGSVNELATVPFLGAHYGRLTTRFSGCIPFLEEVPTALPILCSPKLLKDL